MTETPLRDRSCKPCEGGVKPLKGEALQSLMKEVKDHWILSDDQQKISRSFEFQNFKHAFVFLMGLAHLAEEQGHHPDIFNSYSKVTLTLWTHAIGGLSDNDFIMAAKIDELYEHEFA